MLENYSDIEVLSVDDVCKILNIGKNTAYKMLKNNEIPCMKMKRKYIIPKEGMKKFLESISKIA